MDYLVVKNAMKSIIVHMDYLGAKNAMQSIITPSLGAINTCILGILIVQLDKMYNMLSMSSLIIYYNIIKQKLN
jgi:hypothetical protein